MKHHKQNSLSFDYDDSLLNEIIEIHGQILSETTKQELRLCAENYVVISNVKGIDVMLSDDINHACAVEIVNEKLSWL